MTKTLLVCLLLGFGFVSLVWLLKNVAIAILDWCFAGPSWRGFMFFGFLFSALLFWGSYGR